LISSCQGTIYFVVKRFCGSVVQGRPICKQATITALWLEYEYKKNPPNMSK